VVHRVPGRSHLTTSGSLTEWAGSVGSEYTDIAPGPDGNLWFTDYRGNKIGRISPAGIFLRPSFKLPHGGLPLGIAPGPDGNMWFTEYGGNRIGRITPEGVITEFGSAADSGPISISPGPDGNVWFTETSGNQVGMITPSGDLSEFPVPNAHAYPRGIAEGPDGNLWFGEAYGWAVGRVTDAPAPAISVDPTSGEPSTELTVSGSGYGALEHVRLHFIDSLGTRSLLGVLVTDSLGHLSATVSVPADAAAGHGAVHARGPVSGLRAGAPFLVT
jgi:virginiamycin B lyase